MERKIKECYECGYSLTEEVKEVAEKCVVGETICPRCGKRAVHFLYVDERNLPDKD